MNANVQQWSQRMAVAAMSATRRRSTVPLLLASIAAILAARDMLFPAGVPKGTFAASLIATVLTRSSGAPLPDGKPVSTPAAPLSPIDQWLSQPCDPVSRNLFCPSGKSTPAADGTNAIQKSVLRPAPSADSFRSMPYAQKSQAAVADGQAGRRDVTLPDANQKVSGLSGTPEPVTKDRLSPARPIRLESTLAASAKPTALVNGQMVQEGDVVGVGAGRARVEYRVLRIEARRIFLERNGVELAVTMD